MATDDRFVACIPVDERRCIVVHRRHTRGRDYIRFRFWHRHQRTGCWYPDSHRNGPRAFMLPADAAPGLGGVLSVPVEAIPSPTSRRGWPRSRSFTSGGSSSWTISMHRMM